MGEDHTTGVHGDGAAFNKHESMSTISWNPLVGSGSTVAKPFVFTTIKNTELAPDTFGQHHEDLVLELLRHAHRRDSWRELPRPSLGNWRTAIGRRLARSHLPVTWRLGLVS